MGEPEFLKYLLDIGCDPNTLSSNGKTALMCAVSSASPEKVKILLDANADPNICRYDGTTPLLEAEHLLREHLSTELLQNVYEIFDILIESGADVNAKGYYENETLLLKILKDFDNISHENETISGIIQANIIQMLINAGADVNVQDEEGRYPFELATEDYLIDMLKPNQKGR